MLLFDVGGEGQSAGECDVARRAPMNPMVVDVVEVEAAPRRKDGVAVDARERPLPVVVAPVPAQVADVRKVETTLEAPEGRLAVLSGQFFRGVRPPPVEREARLQPEDFPALRARETSAGALDVLRLEAVLLDPVDDLPDFARPSAVDVVLFQMFHERLVTVEHLVAVSAIPSLNDVIVLDNGMILQADEVVETGVATFTDEEHFSFTL